jgi:hypothetical protein
MKSLLLLSIAACVATPAVASATSQSSSPNPDRVICRSEPVVGSRLAKKQRCMTASEWAELKRLTRETTEKVQIRADERPN